ncbi:hypothetical protein TRAPUB_10314 [Trametes pubescens]|uniref:Uncharacterized protein n=1 Tax=Trametes pubescens TaxID=154538 RepID=A0A1M2VZW3_TRAPU|nr:hypothetical protein TRAPUB_10314 [Trametes pubescens]
MRQRVYFSDKEELYTSRQLSSLVRLAHKYCIVDVEQQALACLKKYFTDKFDLWDNTPGLFVYGHEQHDLSSGIEAIRLARLTNTPEMLPVAFYICTLLEGAVLDGWTRADGAVVHLASEDLRRVIDGYGILQRESHQLLTDQVSVKPHKTCVTPAQCGPILQYLLEKHLENKSPCVLHAFPAYIAYVAKQKLCGCCKDHLTDSSRVERRKLWLRLPYVFDIQAEVPAWKTEP